jgi:hypothetical protein
MHPPGAFASRAPRLRLVRRDLRRRSGKGPRAGRFAELGGGEWNVPQLLSLLSATATGAAEIHAYEMDLAQPGESTRRLVVNARTLDYFDAGNVRLVLSVADVTDARVAAKLSEDLLREKAILLQELQHRIANGPGLGTGIIEALAGRLGAAVAIAPANPGTFVSIVHGGSNSSRST